MNDGSRMGTKVLYKQNKYKRVIFSFEQKWQIIFLHATKIKYNIKIRKLHAK